MEEEKVEIVDMDTEFGKKIHIYVKASEVFVRLMYILLPVSIFVKFYPATIILLGYVIWDLYNIFKKKDYKGVLVRL